MNFIVDINATVTVTQHRVNEKKLSTLIRARLPASERRLAGKLNS